MGHFGTISAPALQQPQSRTLDAVAAVVQQLGAFLALSVVPAADIGSDATEDVARIDTGSPPHKDKGSRNVTVAVAHVGTGLASAVPVGGLLLELSDGLELRQEHVQERPSFVDLLELQLQQQDGDHGSKPCTAAARHARALFQVGSHSPSGAIVVPGHTSSSAAFCSRQLIIAKFGRRGVSGLL